MAADKIIRKAATENGKYVLVARVRMEDWPRIAKAATH